MPVFDCFTFFAKLELPEIRLEERSQAVSVLGLVKAAIAFLDGTKPLHCAKEKARYRRFLP